MIQSPFSKQEQEEIRSNFSHTRNGYIYLNHAAIGPISNRVRGAIDSFLDERNNGPVENFEYAMKLSDETRSLITRYLNAPSSSQISYMGNTSEAISAVSEGFPWREGDEVILNSMEFPTNVQPFRILENRGVKTVFVEAKENTITVDMLEGAITPRTKMISISAVQFLSGFRADLKAIGELCRDRNIYFVVDAIQCLGAFPIDVQECRIDALACGGHKWLMSPLGFGFLYLSEKLASELKPFRTGWLSVEEPWELFNYNQKWQPLSGHLEVGTPNMLGIAGMGASLKTLFETGTEKILLQIQYLTQYLIDRLTDEQSVSIFSPTGLQHRSGIISFTINSDLNAEETILKLKEKKITLSVREGVFRISPHFYNTEEEIEKALEGLL
ncbi:MAG: aminotransferase class V-fold PLP-dependent enzyme [Balneolaceae bacterium]|nr:MAG: aminotransferase class V-fold PLP-dependent enzyme [Balneolaceae bacterium]